MTVNDLIQLLEPYKDKELGKKYIIDFEKGKLVRRVKKIQG